ncbi:uncharacterized protein LOC120357915 [Solenopsis invicta]|uniref:uncharacterized protein LOC120357915 n=1 Tax=Solenopsis invicta TaxID=13686 RepID=UPI00193DE623|nr:uncharacterized protein LOC120357915 [Solenopsis invicta]
MYPCFTICRILGLFPYQINALNIKICRTYYVQSTIITFVSCVYLLYNIYHYNFSEDIEDIDLPIPRKLNDNCGNISIFLVTVITFILSKPRMRLIQTILELSSRLSLESYQNLSKLIHAKDILCLVYISAPCSILIFFSKNIGNFITLMFLLYQTLMMFQMDMLYMNCVFVLKACFKQINDNLMNLTKSVTNAEPHILRGTYYNERNPLVKIKALEKQHLAISNAVQELNMIFSLQLLVSIIRIFAAVTFLLYFVTMRWKIGMMINDINSLMFDMFMIYGITRPIFKLVLLIWVCETGKNQAVDINATVHSVLNSISDKEIKRELQLFALQLLHHKNVFSAKWFDMDVALFTAMVGGITRHLIILIQFLYPCN